MKFKRQIRVIIFAATILGIVGTAWAIQYRLVYTKKAQTALTADVIKHSEPKRVYDPVLLRKLKLVSTLLDIKDKACTYSGVLSVINKADSTQNIRNLDFICCKNDKGCYYRMGNTETLNNKGIYLMVDHSKKEIFVGPQKAITTPQMVDADKLNEALSGENYDLTLKSEGKYQTITLLNEHHITCKQYAITYDTVSLKVTHIYARMSEFSEPLNRDKEKVLDISFSQWTDEADIDQHINIYKILVQEGKTLQLTPDYKNYQLIRLR